MRRVATRVFAVAAAAILAAGCGDAEMPAPSKGPDFTLKMFKSTGENAFAQLAYQCRGCTPAQFEALEPPPEWTKGELQAIVPEGEMRSTPTFDGVPATMDFLAEIPGEEFELIAKTVDGSLVEMSASGIVAKVDVMRDTLFRYPAGSRVHELTDPDSNVYVLFVHEVDADGLSLPNLDDPEALAQHPIPAGWSYTSRVLSEDLLMDSEGMATVVAFRGAVSSAWQHR